MTMSTSSDHVAAFSQPLPEPSVRYLLGHRSRRLTLALGVVLFGSLATAFGTAIGIDPVFLIAPTAAIVSLTLAIDGSTIFGIATALELVVVRLAGRAAPKNGTLVWLFGAYAATLGWILGARTLLSYEAMTVALLAWIVFGPLLHFVTKVVFISNVRGPSPSGTIAALVAALLPLLLFAWGLLQPAYAEWLGVTLIAYGWRCIARIAWIGLVQMVESIQAITDVPHDRVQAQRLMRLVRSTERALNRSRIERGALGFLACHLVYWLGGGLNPEYRRAFLNLRVQRFFAIRRYDKVLDATDDQMTGSLLYLRVQSMIRTRQLDRAESVLNQNLELHRSNPYLRLAKAHLNLERFGFDSEQYRRDIGAANVMARNRAYEQHQPGLTRHVCADAIAEYAKVRAYDTLLTLSKNPPSDEEWRDRFDGCLFEVKEARRLAEKHSVRLATEIRGIEGVVEGLSGDFGEGYKAFLDALASGENLKARYALAVLLMIDSVSFLRPIYHLERVLSLAPPGSRLARLAQARLNEALDVVRTNRALSQSWRVFRLLTFDRRYLALSESESPAWAALAYREDGRKRDTFQAVFGYEASREPMVPDWAPRWTWESLRETGPDVNKQERRDVRVPETAM